MPDNKGMETIEEKWAYWLAALLDGEGNIGINMHKSVKLTHAPNYNLLVCICNTNTALLEKVKEVTGCGSLYSANNNAARGWKPVWKWAVSGKQAEAFLRLTQPYLIAKSGQCELALRFRGLRLMYPVYATEFGKLPHPDLVEGQRQAWLTMKILNRRGVKVVVA